MKLVEEYSTVLSSLVLISNHNVSQVAAQVEAGYAWNQSDINIITYKNKQNKTKKTQDPKEIRIRGEL